MFGYPANCQKKTVGISVMLVKKWFDIFKICKINGKENERGKENTLNSSKFETIPMCYRIAH